MNKKEKQDRSVSGEKKVKRVKTHHVNVDCFLVEEAESANLKSEQCFLQFKEACNQLREVFQAVYLARKLNKAEFDYKAHIADACNLIMQLKRLNRLDKHNCKRSRDAVSERKQKVDALNLQYQNLQYEVTHLQKEVTKCLEFRSQDEDIELVPVEEFYLEAPPSVSKPDITKNDNHELTLARLQWELEQRKRLATKLKQSEITRENCKQSIRKLREILQNIQPALQGIIQATEPLQSKLGMPLQEIHSKHKVAKFLPKPLYILYVEACAYKEACDKNIDISVEGSVDEAKVLQLKLDDVVNDSGESDQDDVPNPKRHRHSVSVRPEDSGSEILNKHPLSVLLTVEGNGSKICLQFCYLYRLCVVTAAVKSLTSQKSQVMSDSVLLNTNTLLNCLFPEDNGLSSPNPANKYQLKKFKCEGTPFTNDKTGLPYVWAQQISGLHFVSSNSSDEDETKNDAGIDSSYMESVINAIRSRMIARISLSQDVATLTAGSAIPSYISEITNANNIKSKLKKWCCSSWADVMSHPNSNKLVELNIINKDAHVYKAVIERGSACLTALVLILPDYPEKSPIFLLSKLNNTAATNINLRELEEEINLHAVVEMHCSQDSSAVDNTNMLLLFQVYHLLACFDVFLETEFCGDTIEGPKEFMQDKVLTKAYRGRSHSRPYKYLASTGIFTHR